MTEYQTISSHFLRRRARTVANRLVAEEAKIHFGIGYRVLKLERGPFRWRVVAYNNPKENR